MSIKRRRGTGGSIAPKLLVLLIFLLSVPSLAAFRLSYSSTEMRLLRAEGTVEILNKNGQPRAVMENARFSSGETMTTGKESLASVGLDESKIVTLDENSRVEFQKKKKQISLRLTEGTLVCDVREKLRDNESLDIRTSTMTLGIRGTYVVVSTDERTDRVVVLEGTAEAAWKDPATGEERTTPVPAGRIFAYGTGLDTVGAEVLAEYGDISVILTDARLGLLPELPFRDALGNETVMERTLPVLLEAVARETDLDPMTLLGEKRRFVLARTVTLVAESAEKTYDGTPLTAAGYETHGAKGLRVTAVTDGALTDVGEARNGFSSIVIYDAAGTDVTALYLIRKVPGVLTVVPAELIVRTGTAYKTFDGTPLSNPAASLEGLVSGETAEVRSVGTIRYVGSVPNTYEIRWGTAKEQNYVLTEKLGTLTIGNPTNPAPQTPTPQMPTPQNPEPTPQTPQTPVPTTPFKMGDAVPPVT